ncbi:MAG: glycerol-3-phosphate 1-O-acyltransferase PlsY [Clostridia bacterium]|nr:glycerol-3-phosphate 1-O-acyltransferase PlsY [Clostridia bacterium]MBP5270484.1 glycerol-3-phosphate 1-O-acyltransferase PlsY [Clostridia bacterium]
MTFKELLNDGLIKLFADKFGLSGAAFMAVLGGLILLAAACGYFLGSLNSAVIFSRLIWHEDIRTKGSGNAGMTNMFRVFGKRAGLLTLLGDFLKTFLSVAIGYVCYGHGGAWIAGLFCMFGHMFPIYYKFKGGKGMLVCAFTLLLTDWPVFLISLAVFTAVLIVSKMVSLGSVMSALTMPLFLFQWYRVMGGSGALAGIRLPVAFLMTVCVIAAHLPNLKRIYSGTEPKVDFSKFFGKKKKDK